MGLRGTHGRARRALLLVAVVGMALWGASPAGRAAQDHGNDEKSFIVLLHDSVADPRAVAAEHARRHGAKVTHIYEHAVKGYAATFAGSGASDARPRRWPT